MTNSNWDKMKIRDKMRLRRAQLKMRNCRNCTIPRNCEVGCKTCAIGMELAALEKKLKLA